MPISDHIATGNCKHGYTESNGNCVYLSTAMVSSTVADMRDDGEQKGSCETVAEFYEGKSVFLTGAAGYLGVILLETLLELCPGIKSVYVLLRAKKGVEPEKRREEMFSRWVFNKVKEEMPEVLEKVQVVTGDVSEPNLGMNDEDLQKVTENANIVFHCAASVNFLKPLKYILQHNTLATQHAIDVSRKLKRLDAFVYTSTAYSNSNRRVVLPERIIRLPFPAQTFIDEIRDGTEESLDRLASECYPNWPNSYTFSKSLAENVLQDNASDLPVIIVRPSIVGPVSKRPLPGYVEETSGITALSVAVGKGFLKLMKGRNGNFFDFVPADLCASTHVIAAWSVGTRRSPSHHVVNCSSYLRLTLRQYGDVMLEVVRRRPLPKTFRKPTTMKIIHHDIPYWTMAYFEHYIPAYIFDVVLKMSGSKIRLTRIYEFAEKAIAATSYFMSNDWEFHTENFHALLKQLQDEDIKKFEVEETRCDDFGKYLDDVPNGSPFWQWSSDKKSLEDRMKAATQRYWITNVLKTGVLVCMCSLLYLIFIVLFRLLT